MSASLAALCNALTILDTWPNISPSFSIILKQATPWILCLKLQFSYIMENDTNVQMSWIKSKLAISDSALKQETSIHLYVYFTKKIIQICKQQMYDRRLAIIHREILWIARFDHSDRCSAKDMISGHYEITITDNLILLHATVSTFSYIRDSTIRDTHLPLINSSLVQTLTMKTA